MHSFPIKVPTPILDRATKSRYLINLYIWGKGDESVFALVPVEDYRSDTNVFSTGLAASGGRMSYTRRAGRFKSSQCTGYPADCNHGVIKRGREVLVHPLDAHLPGDWLNFVIDFEKNTYTLYRNGVFQAEVQDQIPEGDLFMVSQPDTEVDKFYIEEEVDEGIFEHFDEKRDS